MMQTTGYGVFYINASGRQVWARPKDSSTRQCFFSEKAAVRYGREAFPGERLWVRGPTGEEWEVGD